MEETNTSALRQVTAHKVSGHSSAKLLGSGLEHAVLGMQQSVITESYMHCLCASTQSYSLIHCSRRCCIIHGIATSLCDSSAAAWGRLVRVGRARCLWCYCCCCGYWCLVCMSTVQRMIVPCLQPQHSVVETLDHVFILQRQHSTAQCSTADPVATCHSRPLSICSLMQRHALP